MELWNVRELQPPPLNTYKPTTRKLDLKKIRNTLQEGLRFFKDTGYMYAESAVLSRIVYRMKLKFRSAKDFKSLEKLNHALKIFIKANPANYIDNFMDLLPGKYDDETYLPTKNMLDYILVRIQGLAKLLERMFETTKIAAFQLETRIRTGHFWKVALIAIALVARIYVLVKHTAKFLCDYYVDLLKYSFKLENTSVSWLPEGQELPKNLREWLNVTWIDEDEVIEIPSDIPQIMQFFDLVNDDDDDDVQFCDEYIMVNDNEEDVEIVNEFRNLGPLPVKKQNVSHNNMRGFNVDDDIGEIINIEDTVTKQVPQKMKAKKKKTNVVKQLNMNNNEEETTAIVSSEGCEKQNKNNDVGEIISIEDSIREESILHTNNNLPEDYMSKFPDDIGEVITIEDSIKKKTPKKRKLKQKEIKAAKRLKLTGNNNSLNKSLEMISDSESSGIVVLDDTLNNSRVTQSTVSGNYSAILLSDEENQTPKSTQKTPKSALLSDVITNSTIHSRNKTKRTKKNKKTKPLNSGNTSVSSNRKIIKNKKKKKRKAVNNKPKQ